jgi:uncharacterized Zn finger protein
MPRICPKCGSEDTHRIKRKFWMRWFHNSIYIECYRCGQRSLLRNAAADGGEDNPPTHFPQ